MPIPDIRLNDIRIGEVVMPSYNISDGWKNPYYEDWLKSGGWKD